MSVIDLDSFHNGPKIFGIRNFADLRGSFEILIQHNQITDLEPNFPNMIQWNCIRAKQTSVRGFHGARESEGHWKVVTCLTGKIRDAYLDIRPQSETFGCVAYIDLDQDSAKLVMIPPGFSHAFESLSPESIILYGTNIEYANQKEIDVSPVDDKWRQIWENPQLMSNRDLIAPSLETLLEAFSFGQNE
jgi:dTDP-4-dehydrorhamnose 3,5-epimerase-like enzyme